MTTLIFAVGIIGTVLSLLVFASPITTFREVVKKKSTENYKVAPYIATFLCTSLWSFYGGLKPGGFLVAAVNGAGALFHCVYILLFLLYSPQHTKVKTAQYVGVVDVGFLAAVISVTVLGLDGTIQLTVLGMLCSGLTAVMYASPLLAMLLLLSETNIGSNITVIENGDQDKKRGVHAVFALTFHVSKCWRVGTLLSPCQRFLYWNTKSCWATIGLGPDHSLLNVQRKSESDFRKEEHDECDGNRSIWLRVRRKTKQDKYERL
ncbi:hypothetical protein Ahy_B06g081004 [Arachis hypogaea]|uniref:Bidirectional sugar transporter SWEET n=1 Tax=Arachis hypogaea TaxID=3818 RepID=A0A444YJS0_ARAHY|nr:hypothetical protein Ahy_B06g081004 [Arachis hypogaea]